MDGILSPAPLSDSATPARQTDARRGYKQEYASRPHGLQDPQRRRGGQIHRRLPRPVSAHALPEGALRRRRRRPGVPRPALQGRGRPRQAHRDREGAHQPGDQLRFQRPPRRRPMPRVRQPDDVGPQPHPRRRHGGDEQVLQEMRVHRQGNGDQARPVRDRQEGEGRSGHPHRHAPRGADAPPSCGGPHGRRPEDVRPGGPLRRRLQDHPQDRRGPVVRGEPPQSGTRPGEARGRPALDPSADLPQAHVREGPKGPRRNLNVDTRDGRSQ